MYITVINKINIFEKKNCVIPKMHDDEKTHTIYSPTIATTHKMGLVRGGEKKNNAAT